MNTKEKLELLWKYLFLAVVAAGIFRFTDRHHPPSSFPLHLAGNHDMLFIGDDDHELDVRVEQDVVNGDTITKVIINGEEVDVSSFSKKEGKLKWVSEDGEVIVIDIDDDYDGKHKKDKNIRIIKKKIIMRDEK
ncbi:MAG TPA: hypothetical protein EYO07_04195 [Candidatus Marinimicrobia bacterium]|nr:hypothetical protein [Candidatus Neomarinimicrobiota bacterium]